MYRLFMQLFFFIQDFYYVFGTQNLSVDIGLIWSRYSGLFIAFLTMGLSLTISILMEYECIHISEKAEKMINICIVVFVIFCYWYSSWSASLITDVDIKLLLFHVSSLEEYRNFPFIVYCFVVSNKIAK